MWCVDAQEKTSAEIRVHLFQGRYLPAADDSGTLDPYCVVKVCGQQKKTSLKKKTVYPRWYETLSFDVEIPPVRFAPQVRTVRVHTFDCGGALTPLAWLCHPMHGCRSASACGTTTSSQATISCLTCAFRLAISKTTA